jgi:hypothetical protein
MEDYGKFSVDLEAADEDFRVDVAYAVAVAKAARTITAKRSAWHDRRLTEDRSK